MLQRDPTRQRSETEWREAERKRIEMELQQAKHDMESEDLLDRIADNPSGRIIMGSRFQVVTALLLKTQVFCDVALCCVFSS
jgi:hypothetical protein